MGDRKTKRQKERKCVHVLTAIDAKSLSLALSHGNINTYKKDEEIGEMLWKQSYILISFVGSGV